MQDKITSTLNQRFAAYQAASESDRTTAENDLCEIMLQYAKRVVNNVMRELAKDEAEDIATDSTMAALLQIRDGKYRGESEFSTWFFGVIKRHAFDAMGEKIFANRNLESYDPEQFDVPEEKTKQTMEQRLDIKDAMDSLSDEERTVVEMKTQGFSAKEVEATLGLNKARTDYVYRLAKEKLAAKLEGKTQRTLGHRPRKSSTPAPPTLQKVLVENGVPVAIVPDEEANAVVSALAEKLEVR